MAEKVAKITLSTAQKALQSVIAPDISEIKGSIKVLDTKLDGTNSRIEELDKRLTVQMGEMDKRLTTQMGEMDKRLTTEIRALSEKVDLIRDVEKLKIEVAELKRRR
jgi:polyhydroxyalkanoate synthesis regulator phasin